MAELIPRSIDDERVLRYANFNIEWYAGLLGFGLQDSGRKAGQAIRLEPQVRSAFLMSCFAVFLFFNDCTTCAAVNQRTRIVHAVSYLI
jgi:hypothetical protein